MSCSQTIEEDDIEVIENIQILDNESILSENSIDLNQNFINNTTTLDIIDNRKKRNVYGLLKPVFDELVSWLQETGTNDEVNNIQCLMKDELNKLKSKHIHQKNNGNKKRVGTMISSTKGYSKRKKTHGTFHY